MMSSEDSVRSVWRITDCVCFDVDSTVCTDEGVDELANFLQKGEQVKELTNQAMGGSMTFKESFSRRMDIIRPSQSDITRFLDHHPPNLTPGVKELVTLLHTNNIPVYLISGGLKSIIEKVAEELNIPTKNIIANRLKFFHNGDFAGFDEQALTIETGGKPKAIAQLKSQYGYNQVVHIGDGVTDMEASPPAEAFIGFGGNVIRPKVKEGSKWFVSTFQELIDEFEKKRAKTEQA